MKNKKNRFQLSQVFQGGMVDMEQCGCYGAVRMLWSGVSIGDCEYLYYTPFLTMMFDKIKSFFYLVRISVRIFGKYFFVLLIAFESAVVPSCVAEQQHIGKPQSENCGHVGHIILSFARQQHRLSDTAAHSSSFHRCVQCRGKST